MWLTRIFIFFFIAINIFSLQSTAQTGSPYLTHYTDQQWQQNKNWSITQDHHNNMILANRKGIIVFSENKRSYIQTPSMPFFLKRDDKTDTVYVACRKRFGYLQKDPQGVYQYKDIYINDNEEDFTNILFSDSTIYFMGNENIIRINRKNHNIDKTWNADAKQQFTGLFKDSKDIFINVWEEGLYKLDSDTLFPVVSGFWTSNDYILFSIKYDEKNLLIGTEDNELYLFNGYKFYRYKPESYSYLKRSTIMGATNISKNRMAIGTIAGGVVIIDKNTDKTIYTINYPSGLPVDEVYALSTDKNEGLWISHDKGLTRAALELPVKNMLDYPGLEGKPLHSAQVDSTLYVATTNSIYYLTREKQYQTETITVKEEISEKEKEKEKEEKTKEKEEKSDNIFRKIADKLFKKDDQEREATEKQDKEESKQYKYRQKEIYSLESINYIFKETETIDGKYNQLLPFNNGLLVATNNGLFYINNQKESKPVIEHKSIYHITQGTDSTQILVATQEGLRKVKFEDQSWTQTNPAPALNKRIYSSAVLDSLTIWAGGEDTAYRIKIMNEGKNIIKKYNINTKYPEKYKVSKYKDSIYVLLDEGIYKYQKHADSLAPYNIFENTTDEELTNYSYILSQPNHIWINNQYNWRKLSHKKVDSSAINAYLNLFTSIENIYLENDFAWITTSDGLYRINLKKGLPKDKNFRAYISSIAVEDGSRLKIKDLHFNKENKALEFHVSAPNYLRQNKTQYQYHIEGMMEGWSQWRNSPTIQLFTQKGTYTIKARAKNIWGDIQETQTINLSVPPPFTETIWFYGIVSIAVVLLAIAIIKAREKKLQHDKKILEAKVRERTRTIEDQKEEIKIQRDDIEKKKNNLQQKNEEITDSIEYASRIQGALLPAEQNFHDSFSDYFILFKPRDIVSGDFYWIAHKDKKVFVTAADCTGHGVPGAFMSMLGVSFLNEIVKERDTHNHYTASQILDELRKMVKDSLHQTSNNSKSKDGLDLAFCIIDFESNKIQYAGAHNPLFIFRNNGEFEEIKADRMPIGVYLKKEEKPFTNNTINFQKGDTFYMFSDGYEDQFGGPQDKKFKKKNLKNLLSDIYDRSMDEQNRLLDHNFEEWKGDRIQTDDVIMLGFRV
ncbi:MAG: SpoIIE family protein phosphatase [Bacteroidales bacterium]